MVKRISAPRNTTESWIAEVTLKHNGRYTYEDAVYIRAHIPIEITCKDHGNFWQTPQRHKAGTGCLECAKLTRGESQRGTKDHFLEVATKRHGDLYDYSRVVYKSSLKNVEITCKEHGVFLMSPANHYKGQHCPICAQNKKNINMTKTLPKFLEDVHRVHGETYNYSKVDYKSDKVKVTIGCSLHGDFSMMPANHLQGQGCPKCKKCGFNVGKPATLYILTNENITKVGITNRSVDIRIKEIERSGGPEFKVYSLLHFDDGSIPLRLEGQIHKYLNPLYEQVQDVFSGSTECFLDVDLQQLINFVVPIAAPEATNSPQQH